MRAPNLWAYDCTRSTCNKPQGDGAYAAPSGRRDLPHRHWWRLSVEVHITAVGLGKAASVPHWFPLSTPMLNPGLGGAIA